MTFSHLIFKFSKDRNVVHIWQLKTKFALCFGPEKNMHKLSFGHFNPKLHQLALRHENDQIARTSQFITKKESFLCMSLCMVNAQVPGMKDENVLWFDVFDIAFSDSSSNH